MKFKSVPIIPMSLQDKIQEIVKNITPAFNVLGTYSFTGEGESSDVTKSFIQAYEGYQQARSIVTEKQGSPVLVVASGATLCNPDGLLVGEDNPEMDAVYAMATSMGMLPPPLMAKLPEFIMQINHFFIAAQDVD